MIDAPKHDAAKAKRREKRQLRNAHAKGLMQGILSMLRPGDVVIDCGANIGEITHQLAQTGAQTHAFEPDPYAFERLRTRVSGQENVVLHNAAVGSKAGEVELFRDANFDNNPKGGSVKSTILNGGRNINEEVGIKVPLIDLNAFLQSQIDTHGEIAFLKMDIEGAELELLEHMMATNGFDKIRLTVAETHERKFRDLRPRFRKLRQEISESYPITKVNLDWI